MNLIRLLEYFRTVILSINIKFRTAFQHLLSQEAYKHKNEDRCQTKVGK